jgi:predicted membrane channel-forming protein YqfA (hemolysin III family)
MIFVFAFVAVWLAFSPHPYERFYIFAILAAIFFTNLILSLTPCYTDDKYEPFRIAFNIFIVFSLFSLALTWYFYFGTKEEIELFFAPLMLSYVMLLLGFIFYSSHFPECFFTEE